MAAKLEQELRLRVAPEDIPALFAHPRLCQLAASVRREEHLSSTYYDTADDRLARSGIALRVRRSGDTWVQTLKGPPDTRSGAALASRAEFEWPLDARVGDPEPDLRLASDTPFIRTLRAAHRAGLEERFRTQFERASIDLAWPDGSRATLSVDRGTVETDDRELPLCEVEIELERGDVSALFDFAIELATAVPLAVENRSKAERGLQLIRETAAAPRRATANRLDASLIVAQALAQTLRNCVQLIEANADGLRRDDHPEWVHQMRVGTRRLRACLRLCQRAIGSRDCRALVDEVRWLARALGAARDLDVLDTTTLPHVASRHSGKAVAPEDWRTLTEAVAHARSAARKAARDAVASARFTVLVLQTGRLASALELDEEPELRSGLLPYATRILERNDRRLRPAGERLRHLSRIARHRLRLRIKRARYGVDFFAALYAAESVAEYRHALTRLQGLLGAGNDAHVAVVTAERLIGRDTAATRAMSQWADGIDAHSAKSLRRAWRRLVDAPRFWQPD